MTNREWYETNDCSHAHCSMGCEKPQPEMIDGKMLCMKCLVLYEVESECIPCSPDVCD